MIVVVWRTFWDMHRFFRKWLKIDLACIFISLCNLFQLFQSLLHTVTTEEPKLLNTAKKQEFDLCLSFLQYEIQLMSYYYYYYFKCYYFKCFCSWLQKTIEALHNFSLWVPNFVVYKGENSQTLEEMAWNEHSQICACIHVYTIFYRKINNHNQGFFCV